METKEPHSAERGGDHRVCWLIGHEVPESVPLSLSKQKRSSSWEGAQLVAALERGGRG